MNTRLRRSRLARAKPIIGILGGIGAGKSTVARQFEALGCGLIDADALARAALAQNKVKKKLRAWWGDNVLDEKGVVNRAAIGKIVFGDPKQLKRLEGLIHPLVNAGRKRLRSVYQKRKAIRAIVDDTPLLLEKGMAKECDVLVFVKAPRNVRLARVKAVRGWTGAELARREKAQVGLDKKAQRADYVIDNSAGEGLSLAQVRHVLSQILQKHRSGND
jgi:dephospho-CoA kinase